MKPWFLYIVRCADSSLYTGITTNIEKRIAAHNAKKGAAYTRSRGPVVLVYRRGPLSESRARKREAAIKRWTKKQKEQLVASHADKNQKRQYTVRSKSKQSS
jgi:putative endonuclease